MWGLALSWFAKSGRRSYAHFDAQQGGKYFILQFLCVPRTLLSVICATLRLNHRLRVNLLATGLTFGGLVSQNPAIMGAAHDRNWYAVHTVPQHEKSALKQFQMREIESFLPTYETVRVWKNRQRIKLILPLFPTYLFVRISLGERVKVLQSPGVLQIVGNRREIVPLPDSEVEFLRSDFCKQRIEPFRDLVIGETVRIKSGVNSCKKEQ